MNKNTGPKKINTLFERYKKILKAPEQTVIETTVQIITIARASIPVTLIGIRSGLLN